MTELILGIISNGLPILDKLIPSEAEKIRNRVLEYRRQWDEEMSKSNKVEEDGTVKPENRRDDNKLGHLDIELRDIGELFSAALKSAQP